MKSIQFTVEFVFIILYFFIFALKHEKENLSLEFESQNKYKKYKSEFLRLNFLWISFNFLLILFKKKTLH